MRSRSRLHACLVVALSSSLAACASMLEGPVQSIRIHTNPSEGVQVLVNGDVTPLRSGTLHLQKTRGTHFVTFERRGYTRSTISFDRQVDPIWLVANLVWGPAFPIGWFVDWSNGSIYRIDPQDLNVVLRKKERGD